MSTEGYLFKRRCSLTVGRDGQGLELGDLRVVFATHHADYETPNHADIRIYNLAETTAQQIKKEFTDIYLQAGYDGLVGVIFAGQIRQARIGRENGTDTYLDILASDGDRAYNFATVNTTLAAGSTANDQIRVAQSAMQSHDVEAGDDPELDSPALPRGRVMYGMARTVMRDATESTNSTWSIQDGKVQVIDVQGYLPGEAVVLTSQTGLVGQPEQTNEGIKVRALLNPRLKVGGRIKLDNRSISEIRSEIKIGAVNLAPRLDDDGLYRILAIDHSGDTRGNDWYADLICVGIDDSAPMGSKLIDMQGGR